MPNQGFKGTNVRIESLHIGPGPAGAPALKAQVQFVSEEGDVHAVASHSFVLDPETSTDGIADAANALLKLLTKKIESMHYREPASAAPDVLVGIREALQTRDYESSITQG